ncbi:MAG: transposase, partial [Candidatus Delongbacteria bacterium]|nr:transposase [Candidatus Delongbacteria bacterium]
MSSITYHKNKKNGTVYAYSVESYWDKEKKAPRNKQVCLGKVDPITKEIMPSKRKVKKEVEVIPDVSVTSRVAGPYLLLEKLTHFHKLDSLLKKCFPEDYLLVLSIVYYIVHKGGALFRSDSWSNSCLHPYEENITSQRISELLSRLSEDARQQFLSLWLEYVQENDWLCYDITSVSSYARNNEYTHFGYNRDGESLEQINLAMLFGQQSKLPAYYRRLPGNIGDVSTLKTTSKSLDYLGANNLHFVLDRGFYSKTNIDDLFARHHKFTIALPIGRKWVEEILENHRENIVSPRNYIMVGEDEALYTATETYSWGEKRHRGWVHIFYNSERAASEFDKLTKKLINSRLKLLGGTPLSEIEPNLQRYFIINETPKRGLQVGFNDEEIEKYRKKYSGFFCIYSNKIKNAKEALEIYRNKDVVENCFDDLKNHLDMKRIRVHSSKNMDSRLFIQFLALIY